MITFISFAYADTEPVFVAQHNDWEVYTQIEDGQKVCFMVSSPIQKAGNYSRRGNSYLWVRHIRKNIDEVSVTSGYKYKSATSPQIAIYVQQTLDQVQKNVLLDKASNGNCTTNKKEIYTLSLIEKEQAWARETDTDTKLVDEMRKGYHAIVTATSIKDTCSTDIYSLNGFTRAYKQIKSLCEK